MARAETRLMWLGVLLGSTLGAVLGLVCLWLLDRRRAVAVPPVQVERIEPTPALPALPPPAETAPVYTDLNKAPGNPLRRFQARLMRFAWYRAYNWAILPLLVITIFQVNNHTYYNLFEGYDMPEHFYNTYSIMKTGQMPPPPLGAGNYEAHQAPIYYYLSAPVALLGDKLFGDGFKYLIPFALFVVSMAWVLLLVALVQVVMRRVPAWLRALTVCVIAMFPMNIEASVMYGNDMPIIVLGTLAGVTMWLMLRSGRQLEFKLWLRSAALCGYAVFFKNNGVALLAAYAGLAGYLVLDYLRRRQLKPALKIVWMAGIGLPLMLVPWWVNVYHTTRYLDDPIGATSGRTDSAVDPRFFLSFNTRFFDMPFAFGPADDSYWTIQYVTLHGDYYNHWTLQATSERLQAQRTTLMFSPPRGNSFPFSHLFEAILLQYLGVPITLLMVVAILAALFSLARDLVRPLGRRHNALRTGSALVLVLAFAAEAAQAVRFIYYQNVQAVVIHARYEGYLFGFLLMLGLVWYWQQIGRRGGPLRGLLTAGIGASMLAYTATAFALMWLPPSW